MYSSWDNNLEKKKKPIKYQLVIEKGHPLNIYHTFLSAASIRDKIGITDDLKLISSGEL